MGNVAMTEKRPLQPLTHAASFCFAAVSAPHVCHVRECLDSHADELVACCGVLRTVGGQAEGVEKPANEQAPLPFAEPYRSDAAGGGADSSGMSSWSSSSLCRTTSSTSMRKRRQEPAP